MTKKAISRLYAFIEARLSPGGELGLHLSSGVVAMVGATLLFRHIAEAVTGGHALTELDLQLANWLHAHASAGLTGVMLLLTHLHSLSGVAVLAALAGWYLWRRQAYYWLLALALAVPGAMLLNVMLKNIYQRSRPHFEQPLLVLDTYSFPSGHTAAATALYGLLLCYVMTTSASRPLRALSLLAAVLMVALVGTTRLYLGVHYLSDVLGAIAAASAWLAVCITAVSTLRRRRAGRRLSEGV